MSIIMKMRTFISGLLFVCTPLVWAAEQSPVGTHHLAHLHAQARGGDFTLASADGPVSSKSFRGKVQVIYFGYTFCPDACPTTLSALSQGLKQLSGAELSRIQAIFITLDPARDDAVRIRDYARYFHPTMLGLVGTEQELAVVARQYGVLYQKQKVNSAANYVVDHSSYLYVVGADGRLVESLPHGTPPVAIAGSLRAALHQKH